MTSNELRKKYLKFFKERGHAIIPSASLVPENDPTVLFTTAGMHPLVPYLMGEKHPAGNKLTNVQKCIRTGDIDEVGDNTHLTFFEMLGNWSLGDYWKKESITWSFEFLTKELGIEKNLLAVSVFAGDEELGVQRDDESAEIWKNLGISESRIAYLDKENNWWPAGGKNNGPQGPDTEIFYWTGDKNNIPEKFEPNDSNWVEIWNNVFMEFNRQIKAEKQDEYDRLIAEEKPIPTNFYEYKPLKQKNVDTGMGLERTVMILNGQKSVFETDVFAGLLKDDSKESKIVTDHIKASIFILSEGIAPSNTGAGYVLRRIIRRAVRYGKDLDLINLIEKVIDIYKDVYPELLKNKEKILDELKKEKEKFEKTLEQAIREEIKFVSQDKNLQLTGQVASILSMTHGLPLEIAKEIAIENKFKIDSNIDFDYRIKMAEHKKLSQTASAGMFKGGLADAGEETKRLHTATHLLRRALEIVLGEEIMQKGSNITPERLRFDFGFSRKLTPEEIQKVEDLVNQKISENLPVSFEEMTIDEARQKDAVGVFDSKYGEKVKVYTIADFSSEICGGPHVTNTSELASASHPEHQSKGPFKITKEEAVSAGVRRIKAILE